MGRRDSRPRHDAGGRPARRERAPRSGDLTSPSGRCSASTGSRAGPTRRQAATSYRPNCSTTTARWPTSTASVLTCRRERGARGQRLQRHHVEVRRTADEPQLPRCGRAGLPIRPSAPTTPCSSSSPPCRRMRPSRGRHRRGPQRRIEHTGDVRRRVRPRRARCTRTGPDCSWCGCSTPRRWPSTSAVSGWAPTSGPAPSTCRRDGRRLSASIKDDSGTRWNAAGRSSAGRRPAAYMSDIAAAAATAGIPLRAFPMAPSSRIPWRRGSAADRWSGGSGAASLTPQLQSIRPGASSSTQGSEEGRMSADLGFHAEGARLHSPRSAGSSPVSPIRRASRRASRPDIPLLRLRSEGGPSGGSAARASLRGRRSPASKRSAGCSACLRQAFRCRRANR